MAKHANSTDGAVARIVYPEMEADHGSIQSIAPMVLRSESQQTSQGIYLSVGPSNPMLHAGHQTATSVPMTNTGHAWMAQPMRAPNAPSTAHQCAAASNQTVESLDTRLCNALESADPHTIQVGCDTQHQSPNESPAPPRSILRSILRYRTIIFVMIIIGMIYAAVHVVFISGMLKNKQTDGVSAAKCPHILAPSPPNFNRYPNLPKFDLRQSDFAHGTVRLTEAGIYTFQENVQFNPNPADNWYPVCSGTKKQEAYCGDYGPSKAYQLGFFAGITIEGKDIHIDLNGKTFVQHPEHALQQRFFALIELASQPFIPNQGPAATEGGFGSTINACRECSVINGTLGRSSHHGIHGNGAEDLMVENVIFEDYEVAAISCNGCKRVEITRVEARGSFQQVPVRATYSAARFMTIFWNAIKGHVPDGDAKTEIQNTADALESVMDTVFDEIIHGSTGHIQDPEAARQFGLAEVDGMRLNEGNTYGMTFHSSGVLVGPFTQAFLGVDSDKISKDIRIADTVINNTMGRVHEVIGYLTPNGNVSVDVAGSTVRMDEIMNADGTYLPDALHDMRFALAYWSDAEGGNDAALVAARAKKRLGTLNIPVDLVNWARTPEAVLPSAVPGGSPGAGHFVCNVDSMNHKQKGVIGLFLQQTFRVELERVLVVNTINTGGVGSDACGNYGVQADGHFGYTGSQTRGIAVAGSKMVAVKEFDVVTVKAESGSAFGVHAFNDVNQLCMHEGDVADVVSNWIPEGDSPNCPLTKHHSLMDAGVMDVSAMGVKFCQTPEEAFLPREQS